MKDLGRREKEGRALRPLDAKPELSDAPAARVKLTTVLGCCQAPAATRINIATIVSCHWTGIAGQTMATWVDIAAILGPEPGEKAPEAGEEVARV